MNLLSCGIFYRSGNAGGVLPECILKSGFALEVFPGIPGTDCPCDCNDRVGCSAGLYDATSSSSDR